MGWCYRCGRDGLFLRINKNGLCKKCASEPKPSREELIERNAGQSFDPMPPEESGGSPVEYLYTDVDCDLIGGAPDLKPGAVLYARIDGILSNAAGENVAQIKNIKLRRMVNDFYNKQRFSSVVTRLASCSVDGLLCNLAFYVNDCDEDEEDEDGED